MIPKINISVKILKNINASKNEKDSLYIMKYDMDILRSANNEYFTFEALMRNQPDREVLENMDIYILNMEKNIGKTYWLITETNNSCKLCVEQEQAGLPVEDRFTLLFTNDVILKNRKDEINSDILYNYYIKGSKILSKGYKEIDEDGKEYWIGRNVWVGNAIPVMTIGNYSSLQFNGFKKCYWDEYRMKPSIRTLSQEQYTLIFNNFLTFADNFQRSKEKIQFFLLGNNEAGSDPIGEGFEIDKQCEWKIYEDERILYINSSGCFHPAGDKNRTARNLSKRFKKDIHAFLTSNKAVESEKNLCLKTDYDNARFWAFFRLQGIFYEIRINNGIYYVASINEYEWKMKQEQKPLITFAILNEDLTYDVSIEMFDEDNVEYFKDYYTSDRMKFWKPVDRDGFSVIWNNFIGRFGVGFRT